MRYKMPKMEIRPRDDLEAFAALEEQEMKASKKNMHPFTGEQIRKLCENEYVEQISAYKIKYTDKFKEYFIMRWQQGMSAFQIFSECGIDPEIVGRGRIWNFRRSLGIRCRPRRTGNEDFKADAISEKVTTTQLIDKIDSIVSISNEMKYQLDLMKQNEKNVILMLFDSLPYDDKADIILKLQYKLRALEAMQQNLT
jgi:hypothetical protein